MGQQEPAANRLCEHWPQVRQMAQQRGWLRRVACNLVASRFRRRAAERRANQRHGPEPDHEEPDAADALAVRRAVAALPRRQRETVVLRWFVGLSVAETAAELGCAEGTVMSSTHKAMAHLRGAFEAPKEALR